MRHWILSIGLIVSLSGCSGLKPFPTKALYEFDPKAQVCAEYQLVDFDNLKYEHVRDMPLAECPAIFGFTDKDVPQVIDWAVDAVEYSKNNCH